MKKIGEYTARGIVLETETEAGEPQKISLFDGKFTTGYRVTRFQVWGASVSGAGGRSTVLDDRWVHDINIFSLQ